MRIFVAIAIVALAAAVALPQAISTAYAVIELLVVASVQAQRHPGGAGRTTPDGGDGDRVQSDA